MGTDRIKIGVRVEDEKAEPADPWDTKEDTQRRKGRTLDKRGQPVSLSREQLKKGHSHVRGMTGAGKSQLILLPVILQLMKAYVLTFADVCGVKHSVHERDSVFIFDCGGDRALFNATRVAAEKQGRTFRCLSIDSERSHGFDAFQSVPDDDKRIVRLCTLLIEAFHLDHGLVYGGAYFSQRNLAQMLEIAEMAVAEKALGKRIGLKEIDQYIHEKRNQIKDAEQVRMIFRFLVRYEQLMPAPNDPEAIDFKRAIRDREVIYFYTPTLGEATTARQIAGLGLYTAINAAVELADSRSESERDRPLPHCHIVVDEFQELAGRSFSSLLAQARKFGVSIIMANQATEQLENRDLSLADLVRNGTTTKIYFTSTSENDTKELQSYSKESRATLQTYRPGKSLIAYSGKGGESESHSEYITPLLTKNNIIETTATPREFYLIEQGSGYKEPTRAKAEYVLTENEYLRHLNTPLPIVSRMPNEKSTPSSRPETLEPTWQKRHRAAPVGDRIETVRRLQHLVVQLEAEHRVQ